LEAKTKKYKQTIIPQVSMEEVDYRNRAKSIRNFYTENLYGKSVINKDLGYNHEVNIKKQKPFEGQGLQNFPNQNSSKGIDAKIDIILK